MSLTRHKAHPLLHLGPYLRSQYKKMLEQHGERLPSARLPVCVSAVVDNGDARIPSIGFRLDSSSLNLLKMQFAAPVDEVRRSLAVHQLEPVPLKL